MGSNKRHKTDKTRGDTKKNKRQHRSGSRSNSPAEREKSDKHSRHHKKHKRKERKDYDSDVEIVSAPPPPKISRSLHLSTPSPPEISVIRRDDSPPARAGASSQDSLSVQESNKLRAKLGLKPLQAVATTSNDDPDKIKDDLGEFYHKPASNVADIAKSRRIREKLREEKQKRRIESSLSRVKSLGEGVQDGDDDSEDDAGAWVERSRRLHDEKRKADERAKMLDQLDEEFGIGSLVKEEEEMERGSAYTTKDLRGLTVEHDIESFKEGQMLILTLKDKAVLDNDKDVLVNVNMKDDERYERSVIDKRRKPGYDAYAEDHFDEYGLPVKGERILDKYDEEIDGEKKTSFSLGIDDANEMRRNRSLLIKQRLANRKLETLKLAEPKLASEYYNEEELVKFRKPKRKRLLRKMRRQKVMLKPEDITGTANRTDYLRDLGSRRSRKSPPGTNIKDEPDEKAMQLDGDDDYDVAAASGRVDSLVIANDDRELELEIAMRKAQRLKQPRAALSIDRVAAMIKRENERIGNEENVADDAEAGDDNQPGNITLNATAEFCRTLGDIPTYGLAGNREENDQEIMDFEANGAAAAEAGAAAAATPAMAIAAVATAAMENDEEVDAAASIDDEEGDGRGAWNTVQQMEKTTNEPIAAMEAAILDAEPSLGQGVGGALRLAMSKGYLQKEDTNRPSASRFAHLQAQNYSIEDKTYGDDDKFGRRDRFNGPTSEFKEKDAFKPNVKLEYIDDDGHVLCAKEAFRYLSHKFHGKGPGKNKVEKRMKKAEQEVLMKRMSSTDTPLGTLNLLQAKQKETQSPYIVLSGSKHMQTTSISKSKH